MRRTEDQKAGRPRKTAIERRDEILDAAVAEFALRGFRGASVGDVAGRVGITQPYVYRLFGTKKGLFLAAVERVCARVLDTFRKAAEAEPEDALGAMGRSYTLLLFRREELLFMLQGFAAAVEDAEVRDLVGRRFAELWRFVEEASGAGDEEVWAFLASGMLLNINVAIDLASRAGKEEWLRRFMGAGE